MPSTLDKIINAASGGDIAIVKRFIDKEGNSLLTRAIIDKHYDIAIKLIPYSNVNIQNKKGESPLELAINAREKELANQLIRSGANVNQEDSKGESLLMRSMHREEMALLLIEAGANVESSPENTGDTPLIKAINWVNKNIVNAILQKNPKDINKRGHHNQTALFIAVSEGVCDSRYEDIVKSLVMAGTDPYISCSPGDTTVFKIPGALTNVHFGSVLLEYKQKLEEQKRSKDNDKNAEEPPAKRPRLFSPPKPANSNASTADHKHTQNKPVPMSDK